jgi:7 transmembrane receptor (rhodopsin family)
LDGFQLIICIIWLLALVTALPILLLSELTIPDVEWYSKNQLYVCSEKWDSERDKSMYTNILFLLQYCFPLLVLLFTYGRIGIEIWGKRTPGEAHRNRDLRFARSKRKVIFFLINFNLNL